MLPEPPDSISELPGPAAALAPPQLEAAVRALPNARPTDLPTIERLVGLLLPLARSPEQGGRVRQGLRALIDAARERRFLAGLTPDRVEPWLAALLPAMEASEYTIGTLLRTRAEFEPHDPVLRTLEPEGEVRAAALWNNARELAAGFATLLEGDLDGRIAFLSENCVEVALCDLACLAHGLVSVPVPANAAADQVQFVLRHSEARILVVSSEAQLAKILSAPGGIPSLQAVVSLSPATARRHRLRTHDEMRALGTAEAARAVEARAGRVRSGDLATVMYTSGTTGEPKGIAFTHFNLVSKRLCRSFALPDIGPGDVSLSYLPLFHTFGRWFELLGALWTGATYAFARSPGIVTLVEDFARVRPTLFTSVPQKWMELHEHAAREAASEDPDRIAQELRRLTGGRLRFGLSAAGYLEPRIFQAFRRAGVELCSGYGMTEATGGATMTPPGEYVEGSIGKPLPGIEARVEPDGELLLRGPYMMRGYYRPSDGRSGLDAHGWFATGDLVTIDERGHFRLTGRKKEIYKDRKGQTIAPQRIENLFREFDAVGQTFLVGEGREFNTLLIWPDYERQPSLKERNPAEIRLLLGSLVASANRFLAPYERVVDFAVLDRPLSEAHGELTPKGTFKRQVVERNWAALIEPMYRRAGARWEVGGVELRAPDWILREIGLLREDLSLADGTLRARDRTLRVEPSGGGLRVGDYVYRDPSGNIDLGRILGSPVTALGNESLRVFVGDAVFFATPVRRRGEPQSLEVEAPEAPRPEGKADEFRSLLVGGSTTVESLHAAAVLLRGSREDAARAIAHLSGVAAMGGDAVKVCRSLLARAADLEDPETRRRAFEASLPLSADVKALLDRFLRAGRPELVTDPVLERIVEAGLSDGQVESLLAILREACTGTESVEAPARERLIAAMRILAAYAGAHPVWFSRLRIKLARLALHADEAIGARAGEELDRLQLGFRAWLGPNLRLAVDPESGREYGWREVVDFARDVPEGHRTLLRRALTETCLVREASFLFGKGGPLALANLPPGGVSIGSYGSASGHAAYRVSVTARSGETFDVVAHVAESVPVLSLREEIRWLLAAGAPPSLTAALGGYYPEHGLYTTELVPGETVAVQLARVSAMGATGRLRALWPFLGWTSFAAHVAFWERTGGRLALAEPSPANVVAPSHDYQVGGRLVSVWGRTPCGDPLALLTRFEERFVAPVEEAYPGLRGGVDRRILLSAFAETLGEERAVALLRGRNLPWFLEELAREGLTPQRVWFAAQRYGRWIAVNPAATLEARAATLADLWATYRLEEVERRWPHARVAFFRRTVFAGARHELAEELAQLAREARAQPIELADRVGGLRSRVSPTAEEDYFLARLAYRHLGPAVDAALVALKDGSGSRVDVVVNLVGADGLRFAVRCPSSPREVARLLQLFHEAGLPVVLGGEHEYLVAVDEKGIVLGGLFFGVAGERAHLEKIVVARPFRKRGVADGLMQELMRRLRERGVKAVETGFFFPEYLRRFGFRTEPHSGGLFQELRRSAVRIFE